MRKAHPYYHYSWRRSYHCNQMRSKSNSGERNASPKKMKTHGHIPRDPPSSLCRDLPEYQDAEIIGSVLLWYCPSVHLLVFKKLPVRAPRREAWSHRKLFKNGPFRLLYNRSCPAVSLIARLDSDSSQKQWGWSGTKHPVNLSISRPSVTVAL